VGDRRKCQTYAASPAEPGGLLVMLGVTPRVSNPRRNIGEVMAAAGSMKSPPVRPGAEVHLSGLWAPRRRCQAAL
jgi:hypothetical protein